MLLVSGGIIFLTTALLFPVATRWGTFLHASGPLLIGLTVPAVLGTDALMARVSRMRGWGRTNVSLGPIALVAVAVLLGALQLTFMSRQAGERQRQMAAVVGSIGTRWPHPTRSSHRSWRWATGSGVLGRGRRRARQYQPRCWPRCPHCLADEPRVSPSRGRGALPTVTGDMRRRLGTAGRSAYTPSHMKAVALPGRQQRSESSGTTRDRERARPGPARWDARECAGTGLGARASLRERSVE
jgi:hypothetical protein